MKIYPLGAELFHADGRTHRHDQANLRTCLKTDTLNLWGFQAF